jgi:hypothetical protein
MGTGSDPVDNVLASFLSFQQSTSSLFDSYLSLSSKSTLSFTRLQPVGMCVSLMPSSTVRQIHSAGALCTLRHYKGTPLHSTSGDSLSILGQVMLQITIGLQTLGIDFIVVDTCPASMIIGTQDLARFNATLDLSSHLLQLGDESVVLSIT